MPGARLELARFCGAVDFESTASANSAIPAWEGWRDLTGKGNVSGKTQQTVRRE